MASPINAVDPQQAVPAPRKPLSWKGLMAFIGTVDAVVSGIKTLAEIPHDVWSVWHFIRMFGAHIIDYVSSFTVVFLLFWIGVGVIWAILKKLFPSVGFSPYIIYGITAVALGITAWGVFTNNLLTEPSWGFINVR